jgi:ribosomal protein L37AE/L43A
MARPQKYKSDAERIRANRVQKNNYSRKEWECDKCGCKLQLGNKSNHFKSEKHVKNLVQSDKYDVFENTNISI